MKIRYKRTTVNIKGMERKGECEICARRGRTEMHHTKYAYNRKQVKKNPKLALENTIEICFQDHIVMNAIRICHEAIRKDPVKYRKMMELDMKSRGLPHLSLSIG